jgi:threonine/homoserine/homoserine lactone efflux protein
MIWTYAIEGLLFGFAIGFTPGPLFVLVVRETITRGWRSGTLVSLAPLLTDVPLIIISVLLFSALTLSSSVVGAISIIGALLLCWLAWETLRTPAVSLGDVKATHHPFWKGVATNATNPHLYINYLTISSALFLRARAEGTPTLLLFASSYVLAILMAKFALVGITARMRNFVVSHAYRATLVILALALFVYALSVGWSGISALL